MATDPQSKAAAITKQALSVNPQTQQAQDLAYRTPAQLPPATATMDTPPSAVDLLHAQLYTTMQQCACPLCEETLAQWGARANRSNALRLARAQASQPRRLLLHEQIAASAALLHEQKRQPGR